MKTANPNPRLLKRNIPRFPGIQLCISAINRRVHHELGNQLHPHALVVVELRLGIPGIDRIADDPVVLVAKDVFGAVGLVADFVQYHWLPDCLDKAVTSIISGVDGGRQSPCWQSSAYRALHGFMVLAQHDRLLPPVVNHYHVNGYFLQRIGVAQPSSWPRKGANALIVQKETYPINIDPIRCSGFRAVPHLTKLT